MKIAWFPIVLLACAIPWPALLYSRVAMPLQQLSASVAVGTLRLVGVSDAVRSGTKILMGGQALNVAEACAGMKSLMTFITVAAAVAFLSSRVMWQKIVITLSAIPIAIFCNMSRVTVQGLLSHLGYHEWSEDFAHAFVGLVMMVPAFFLILLVAYILDNIFIEEADRRRLGAAAGKGDQVGLIIEVPRPGGIASRKPVVGNMDRPVPAPAESPKPVPAKAPSEPMAAPAAAATAAPAAASSSTEDLAAATRRLAAGGSIRRSQPSGLGRKPASPAAQTQPQNDGEKK
jgi:exosortase/archaeosortase family protein